MTRPQKRLLALIAGLLLVLLLCALVYQVGMDLLEGRSRSFWDSLEWAGETLSTTGYGRDDAWRHPAMVVFVVLVQFIGVFLIFLVFPVYLIPFLEQRFEARLPTEDTRSSGHLIVWRHGPAVATLLEEVEDAGLHAVVLEPDPTIARRLHEAGLAVIHRRLEDDALARAGLERARAVIANGTDDENATVILAARQSGFRGEIYSLVEVPLHRRPMELAGATAVFTPRHVLGAALAARASHRISPTVAGVQSLSDRLRLEEIRLQPDSPLAGRSLAESGVGRATGATVVGQWIGGRLQAPLDASTRLAPGALLVVLGSEGSIASLADECSGARAERMSGPFLVAGFGEVGQKVVELLHDAGEPTVVIDREERPGVQVVGDVLLPSVLERAGIGSARALILALSSDTATVFAAVLAKDLAPDLPVFARVNEAENVQRIYRAGADFALSISQVAGQILARRLLGRDAVAVDARLEIVRLGAGGLAGETPSRLELRRRSGISVVAVERGEQVFTEVGPEFRFEEGDVLYLLGDRKATERFADLFPVTATPPQEGVGSPA